jgi:hypothetical protein
MHLNVGKQQQTLQQENKAVSTGGDFGDPKWIDTLSRQISSSSSEEEV